MHCSHKEEWGAFEWSNIGQYTDTMLNEEKKGVKQGMICHLYVQRGGDLKICTYMLVWM